MDILSPPPTVPTHVISIPTTIFQHSTHPHSIPAENCPRTRWYQKQELSYRKQVARHCAHNTLWASIELNITP